MRTRSSPKLSYERLPLSRGRFAFKAFNPATKLLSHFIELFRKQDILLVVERSDVPDWLIKEADVPPQWAKR